MMSMHYSTEAVHPVPEVHLDDTHLNGKGQAQLKGLPADFENIFSYHSHDCAKNQPDYT